MAKSTKSYEERMLEMEKKEQESLEKAKPISFGMSSSSIGAPRTDSTAPPKVLSDQSHDIPTRKKIIPCASSDTQPRTYVCKRKENVIMAKSTKSYEERMLEMEKKKQHCRNALCVRVPCA